MKHPTIHECVAHLKGCKTCYLGMHGGAALNRKTFVAKLCDSAGGARGRPCFCTVVPGRFAEECVDTVMCSWHVETCFFVRFLFKLMLATHENGITCS